MATVDVVASVKDNFWEDVLRPVSMYTEERVELMFDFNLKVSSKNNKNATIAIDPARPIQSKIVIPHFSLS